MGPLSEECERGKHDFCDSTNLNSPLGCECDCHWRDDDE